VFDVGSQGRDGDAEPARARALAEQARDEYLAAQGDFAKRLAEIDAWLRTR
jgi:hypothetical protein